MELNVEIHNYQSYEFYIENTFIKTSKGFGTNPNIKDSLLAIGIEIIRLWDDKKQGILECWDNQDDNHEQRHFCDYCSTLAELKESLVACGNYGEDISRIVFKVFVEKVGG